MKVSQITLPASSVIAVWWKGTTWLFLCQRIPDAAAAKILLHICRSLPACFVVVHLYGLGLVYVFALSSVGYPVCIQHACGIKTAVTVFYARLLFTCCRKAKCFMMTDYSPEAGLAVVWPSPLLYILEIYFWVVLRVLVWETKTFSVVH